MFFLSFFSSHLSLNPPFSVGNDKLLRIGDVRDPHHPVSLVPEIHKLAINYVSWNPYWTNMLVTSSFDGTMTMCDLRVIDKPCRRLVFNDKGRDSQGGIMKPFWTSLGERIVSTENDKRGFVVWNRDGTQLFSCESSFGLRISQMSPCSADSDKLFQVCHDGSLVALQVSLVADE